MTLTTVSTTVLYCDVPRRPQQTRDCERLMDTFPELSVQQRTKLLALLDKYSECFSENTGFVTMNQHELDVSADCRPRRLEINYILEDLKPFAYKSYSG